MLSMSRGEKPQQQPLLDEEAGHRDADDTSSVASSVEALWNDTRHQSSQNQHKDPPKWLSQLPSLPRKYRFYCGLVIILAILVLWTTPYRHAVFSSIHQSSAETPEEVPSSYYNMVHAATKSDTAAATALSSSVVVANSVATPASVVTSSSELPSQTGTTKVRPIGGLSVHPWRNQTLSSAEFCTTWPLEEDGGYMFPPKPSQTLNLNSYGPPGGWKKPKDIKIIAMVFYGRLRNVDILDCYLQQNLALNGGFVDEVWFMVHTTIENDVEWLKELTDNVKGYKFVDLGKRTTEGYGYIWEHATEDQTIYIKIDDDILYIHHDAIPQLISTRLAQPHPYAVSAQLVNSPMTGMQQYHYGAIHPFVPDRMDHPSRPARQSWRPSDYGLYPKAALDPEENPMDVKSPYRGHPWLLLSDDSRDTAENLRTALADWDEHRTGDIAFGPGWTSWAAAAQQQYSLLYNIEKNQVDRYHFGRAIDFGPPKHDFHLQYEGPGGEQVYDTQYRRYNLNFVAVWGHDIREALPINDDEKEITADIPRRLRRPFIIDTRAVVSHLSFYTQKDNIYQTDLMDRYRALANEIACEATNLKRPFDTMCPGF